MSEEATKPTDSKEDAQRRVAEAHIRLGLYEHYKGGRYILYGASVKEDTLEVLVHYYSCEKRTRWTRTAENFFATMFAGAAPFWRFKFLTFATAQELAEAAGISAS